MKTDNQPNGDRRPRRRKRFDGLIEEWSAAMGRVLTIPADPQPRRIGPADRQPQAIDLSEDAAGWERLRTYLRRLRG